jgi:hypothetical protein
MRQCPHCGSSISLTELLSERLFTPRSCKVCGGGYIEGGTSIGFSVLGIAGAIATHIKTLPSFPNWAPMTIFACAGAVAVGIGLRSRPVKSEIRRRKLLLALVLAPIAAMLTWQLLEMIGSLARAA